MERFKHTTLKGNVITLKFSDYIEAKKYIENPINKLDKKKLNKAGYTNEKGENIYVVSWLEERVVKSKTAMK